GRRGDDLLPRRAERSLPAAPAEPPRRTDRHEQRRQVQAAGTHGLRSPLRASGLSAAYCPPPPGLSNRPRLVSTGYLTAFLAIFAAMASLRSMPSALLIASRKPATAAISSAT